MKKIVLLLLVSLLTLSFSLFAQTYPYIASWQSSFFTDDSPYYTKIYRDGFVQRLRIESNYCYQISKVELVLKNKQPIQFSPMTEERLAYWPKLYGQNPADSCWYDVQVRGLNLNNPENTKYIIKFTTSNNEEYYFGGLTNSMLPSGRLYSFVGDIKWNDFGPLGATPTQDGGVFYKIWEPIADEVHLFINDAAPIKMISDSELRGFNSSRSHVALVPTSKPGDFYYFQFLKGGQYESQQGPNREITAVKIDPMARAITYKAKGALYNNYIDPRGIVYPLEHYPWTFDNNIQSMSDFEHNNWIIYQLWPATFNPKKVGSHWMPGTFRDIVERADYITDLGVTAVELLPIHESRFYAGWGYALNSPLLIDKSLGQPQDLKYFVDVMHQRKIRTIFDVVLNHINNDLIRDPLSKTVSQSKYFNGYNWGPLPRFASPMVKKWLSDSLLSLMRDYHVDGFRFDMIKYIYTNNEPGYRFLQEMTQLLKQENPKFYTIAEELPNNVWTTYSVEHNGLGFDTQWNDLFKNFFEKKFQTYRPYHRQVSPWEMHAALLGFSNHQGLHFGAAPTTLNYLGSHDFIGNENPFIRIVSDYNIQESVGNQTFNRIRPLEDPINTIDRFRLIHNTFTHDATRMAYSILFTKPGAIMFYQGEELAQDLNIQNEWDFTSPIDNNSNPTQEVDYNRFIGSHRMPWEYLSPGEGALSFLTEKEKALFRGHYKFFKEMIRFRRFFSQLNAQHATNVQVFNNNSILTYELTSGEEQFFVVVNFGYEEGGTWINFPGNSNTWWEELQNSSSPLFGGETAKFLNIISNMGGRMNQVRLAPSSVSVFRRMTFPSIKYPLFLRGTYNNWQAERETMLAPQSQQGEVYGTVINITAPNTYEFKLATVDWAIEMGLAFNRMGGLTYLPWQPNIRYYLAPGKYRFVFNLKTFEYSFIQVE